MTLDLVRSAKHFLRPLKNGLTSRYLARALGREFDPIWYRGKYLTHDYSKEPLGHYLAQGIRLGYSIGEGIHRAVSSLDDIESRLRGANIPGPRCWHEVFDDNFFDKLSGFCMIGPVAERKRRLQPTVNGVDL
jgi:hypothetical protein